MKKITAAATTTKLATMMTDVQNVTHHLHLLHLHLELPHHVHGHVVNAWWSRWRCGGDDDGGGVGGDVDMHMIPPPSPTFNWHHSARCIRLQSSCCLLYVCFALLLPIFFITRFRLRRADLHHSHDDAVAAAASSLLISFSGAAIIDTTCTRFNAEER